MLYNWLVGSPPNPFNRQTSYIEKLSYKVGFAKTVPQEIVLESLLSKMIFHAIVLESRTF